MGFKPRNFVRLFSPLNHELYLNRPKIKKFSFNLKENTTLLHYKEQLVFAVYGNNCCFFRETYETYKYIP
jgi:hypothetical protein